MKNILFTFIMAVVLIMTTITSYCIDPPKEKGEIELASKVDNNFNTEASESHYVSTPCKGGQEGNGTDFDLWNIWELL